MSDKDNLGDRMKEYEAAESGRRFIPLLPVYARIDGKCFSRFTGGMDRPYDLRITNLMVETTQFLIEETHARIGYTQSDEISLVWLQERYDSELPFGGKIQKLVSVLASLAAAKFNALCMESEDMHERAATLNPSFDCRAFQLPNKVEAANVFLWREQDAAKNAVSMAARSFYSHKALQGKNGAEMQEMLFQKGQSFNDYPAFFKRGTFLRRVTKERQFTAAELDRIPAEHRPSPDMTVLRSEIVKLDMPIFSKVTNRAEVIFDGANPVLSDSAGGESVARSAQPQ